MAASTGAAKAVAERCRLRAAAATSVVARLQLLQWAGSYLSPHAFTWLVGADIGWNPVTNLNFDLELMYQAVNQDKPNGFLGTIYGATGFTAGYYVPGAWEGNSSGFAGRLRITRYF